MELCDYLEKIQPIDKSYISYAEKDGTALPSL